MVHSSYARLVEKIQQIEDENKILVKLVENLKGKNKIVSNINIFKINFNLFQKFVKIFKKQYYNLLTFLN